MHCYVAIGGNFENTYAAFRRALFLLDQTKGITHLHTSRLYVTTPVSDNPLQPDYLNAVASFKTTLPLLELWHTLNNLEEMLGKRAKPKNAARLIDLDLLFYGKQFFHSERLSVPHPRWQNRLFVVAPLKDLLEKIELPTAIDIKKLCEFLFNQNQEKVVVCDKPLPFQTRR